MDVTGFITAGGQSSRMGRDKAWLEIGGRAMIEHVIAALAPAVSELAIIANSDQYKNLGFPVYEDKDVAIGPLEAFRVALTNSRTRYAVVVACDLPFVTTPLFDCLIGFAEGFDGAAPLSADGQLEPLCAVFSTDALSSVTRLIEEGHRKPARLFDSIRTRFVRFEEIAHLKGSSLFFTNVNTAEDYSSAKAILDEPTRELD